MKKFIQDCLRTESIKTHELIDKDGKTYNYERLDHACLGLATEIGEFIDPIKKARYYGKLLDVVNLKEELGDALWYIAVAMDELGTDFETETARVINKLHVRYPEKFTGEAATNRDLDAERKVLEDGRISNMLDDATYQEFKMQEK